MQNKNIFRQISYVIGLSLFALFFVFPISTEASTEGSIRACIALKDVSSGTLLSATASTTPVGQFSLSLATTKDFSSPIISTTFDAQSFVHNTTIDGMPVQCTSYAPVSFGSYYYNNVSVTGSTQWNQTRYFDMAETFVVSNAAPYSDVWFNVDPSDDLLGNNTSDGVLVVNENQRERTVIVLATYTEARPVVEASPLNQSLISLPIDQPANLIGQSPLNPDLISVPLVATPAACVPGVNLIANSGFEFPVVTLEKKWDIISFTTANLGWTSTHVNGYGLEIQAGIFDGLNTWLAHQGTQYAEIDGGKYHDVTQTIATVPGKSYTLTFWTSPRPHQDASINQMNLFINDALVDTYIASGTPVNVWTKQTHTFVASTTTTRISFVDAKDASTGTAMYLDSVSLTCDQSIENMCTIPNTLGDTQVETIQTGVETTLQSILNDNGYTLDVVADQKQYQTWGLAQASTTFEVELMGGVTAADDVFGYYTNGDLATFIPLFRVGSLTASTTYNQHASAPVFTPGQKVSFTLNNASEVAFAIHSDFNNQITISSTENAKNTDGLDHVVVYDVLNSDKRNFVLGFEDLPNLGDFDYQDVIVRVQETSCAAVNTPPTITLVGQNPVQITTGTSFVDPGATANDLEDGNLTSAIVVTGTVNVNVPGTYTLTYTVTDSGGLSASTTRQVVVSSPSNPPVNACVLVSDTTTQVIGGTNAVLSYVHPIWTTIPGASWIWSTEKVIDSTATTTAIFSKTFTATSTPTSAILSLSTDNSYVARVNGVIVAQNLGEFNYSSVATYNIASAINPGVNTITFEVTNFLRDNATPESNPAGLIYKLELSGNGCGPVVTNTPPTITLVGANPATLTTGQAWVEPGATANDLEDGNLTSAIVVTGTVNVNVPGTYTLTYTVTDSGGLSASTTRQVIVSNPNGGGPTSGSIRFCSIFANKDNVITTSSTNLPAGTFAINLATTTDIVNSTVHSKTWNATSFAPNTKIILSQNDADCVTFDNLPFGTYYYSELSVNGSLWIVSSTSPRYNDQLTTPVNNIFDLFAYSGELFTATSTDDASRNVNSDGQIVVSADRREHTLVIATKHEDKPIDVGCPTCGGGTVTPPGGGGGGNGPIVSSLAITNEKVVEITPGVALVTWNTNLPATKEVGYGNASQPASFIVAPFGYATSTPRVSEPLSTVHSYTIAIESGKTYYFRPVSTDFKTTVAGIELVLNPGTGVGGGGGVITNPNTCYYLFDYLKQGWNNNPVEVKKLQVFLRDLEGFTVEVNGIYDDQTVAALNAFQNRYKADILTPWGHTAPTSFTYITTKKKVNEIYCKMAFPVTTQQQSEIDAYRAFLQGLSAAGVTVGAPTVEQINKPIIIDTTDVGVLPPLPTSSQVTLAGDTSTTTFVGQLTANTINSTKRLGNLAGVMFGWPWDWVENMFGGEENQCSDKTIFSNWFNWILIIVILTMSYLWYRERQENKKALKLNEELDLINK